MRLFINLSELINVSPRSGSSPVPPEQEGGRSLEAARLWASGRSGDRKLEGPHKATLFTHWGAHSILDDTPSGCSPRKALALRLSSPPPAPSGSLGLSGECQAPGP